MADKLNIKKAIKRPGALTKKAKAAGMTTTQFANKATAKNSKASALTKKQANFFKFTLKPIIKRNKGK